MDGRMRARLFFAAISLIFLADARASEFMIKGWTLGEAPSTACRGAEIDDRVGNMIREMASKDVHLMDMRTNSCNVQIDNFGGYKTRSPAILLFFEGRLMSAKIEMEGLPMEAVGDVISAIQDEYGKPSISRSKPFTTHKWTMGASTLRVERTSRGWDDNDLIVILRDERSFKRYDALFQANKKILNDMAKRETRRSVIN